MTFEYLNIPVRSSINLPSLRQIKFVLFIKNGFRLSRSFKGHHAYNHDYLVSEELICEFEYKYSHNSIEVKSKNKDVTIGHVPEPLAAILFPLRKAWKVYEIQEGTWVLGGGIEIPCKFTIIGPKIRKKNYRKELRKTQL